MAQGKEAFLSMVANADEELMPTSPEALAKWFQEEWVTEERAPALDSQEASESATVAERNRRLAGVTFRQMDPTRQTKLIEAAVLALGQSAATRLLATLRGK